MDTICSFSRATACNAIARLIYRGARLSVRPSVYVFVTLLYCVQTTLARIT